MSTIGRAPKDYNAGAWGRIVGRIDKAINTLAKRLGAGEDATRQLQITQREQRAALASMLTPEATFEWSEYVDSSTEKVYGQCIIEVTRGWGIISDFEYREGNGNVDSLTTWTSYKTGPNMSFVLDSTYKGGGYYLYRKELPFIKGDDRVSLVSVDLRGKAANDDVWLQSSHTFDGNTVPQFRREPKLVLQWYSTTETWQVRAIGEADNDTLSVGFDVSDNVQLSETDGFVYTDFTTGVTDITGNDKRFNVLLGSFTPSTKASQRVLYVAAAAFDAASATPANPDNEFAVVLLSIEIPVSPTAAGILDAGDITGELLADTAKRASVNLTASHTPGSESTSVTVSGTIQYDGDSTVYTISSQAISVGSSGALYYIYFDPSVSTSLLQSSTTKTDATQISGKRIFVGIASGDSVERAFFVFTSDAPVISAPYVYASKLEALTATMGTLEAGNAKIGDNVNGSNDGLYISTHNYWYDTGSFKVGSGTDYIEWDGSNLNITSIPVSYNQSTQPTGDIKYGDLWYDSTPNVEALKWYDGSVWSIIGDTLQRFYAPSSTTTISGDKIRTGALESNNWSTTAGSQLDLTNGTIKLGGSSSPSFSVTSAGVMSCTGATVSGAITATSGNITGSLTMGASGIINFTGGGYLSPRTLNSGTGTLYLDGQDIRIGDTSGGEIYVGAQNGDVSIYSRDGNTLALSASGGTFGADITLTASDDISLTASGDIVLSATGSAMVGSNAIWHAGNLPFSFSSVASGDVIYYNGTNWVNLAKGTDGQVLTLASGLPSWAAGGSGSGTVTQINTGGGLSGGPITTTGTISIDFPTTEVSLFDFRAFGIDSEQEYRYLEVSSVGADIVGGANAAAVKTTLSLDQVENQALSTWSGTSNIIYLGNVVTGTWSATNISLAKGGTGASLSDPNADRILFWDDSASTVTWLSAGEGIAFNGTSLQMDWSAATGSVTPYKAVVKDGDQNVKTITLGSLATASSVNLSSQVSGSLADAYISSAATWNAKIDTAGEGLSKSSTTLSLNSTIPSVGDWNFTAIGLDNAQNYSGVTITSFASTLLDDTSASAARSTLGLGGLATASTINNTNWSGADLAIANGGTGASTAANARTNLGLGSGLTTTVQETQINSPGGGDNDQWRERTLTFTNGILTATGSWSAYEEIVAGI
jgi:hypothetical protein